jgi:uncharacterized protein YwlG (UPF0340 family)
VAVLLLASILPGCVLVAVGAGAGAAAGGVAYYMGELRSTERATPPEIVAATKTALGNLYVSVISSSSDELSGEVLGRTSSDEKVQISVEYKSDGLSQVGIRVGTFGDEDMSRRILNDIEKGLPTQTGKTGTR